MSQISALIAGKNKNYDYQLSALARFIINSGVSGASGLEVTPGSVASGEAFILCTRTNGQQIMLHYQNTAAITIDTTGTTKVWIGVDQSVIDDGSSNALDGTGIATIRTGASYPVTGAYLKLASITGGVITDERVMISGKPMLQEGFELDKHKVINRSTGKEELKNVTDGSVILPTHKMRLENESGDYEDITMSLLQNSIAGMTSEYIFAGSAVPNESVYLSDLNKYKSGGLTPIGQTVAKTTFMMYSAGDVEQSYTFYFSKTGAPQDLTFRIETDNAGVASGTLVNASAVLQTAIASIPSEGIYKITLPAGFVNAPAGTPIHFVFWQGSQYVNASNYLSIGINQEVCVVYDNISGLGADVLASRAVSSNNTPSGAWTFTAVMNCTADCKLESFGFYGYAYGFNTVSVMGSDGSSYTSNHTAYNANASTHTFLEPIKLKNGIQYTISASGSGTYTNSLAFSSTTNSAHLTWVSCNGIIRVTTKDATFAENIGVLRKYLSKANATTAVKSAVYAILPQGAEAGGYPAIIKDRYVGGFSNLMKGTTYYLSNAGVISSTPGTVSKVLGVAINSTTIRIDSAINA